jgi:hypothetical protein
MGSHLCDLFINLLQEILPDEIEPKESDDCLQVYRIRTRPAETKKYLIHKPNIALLTRMSDLGFGYVKKW